MYLNWNKLVNNCSSSNLNFVSTSRQSFGFWPYPLSPGLAISALVCLDFTYHLPSSTISFSWHHRYLAFVHVQTISTSSLWGIPPSGTCVPLSRCIHISHHTWSSLIFPLAYRSMRISIVCNFLSSFFLTAQHPAPYTMAGFIVLLYTLSFNFVGMFLSHITPVVSLHFDQAIFTLLFTSFSAPLLASNNEPRYFQERFHWIHFIFLNVDSLVFFWAWHAHCFSSAYS